MNKVFLHTGSNLGDRKALLEEANRWIGQEIGEIVQSSRIYKTKAWGITEQPDFLNQALEVHTELSPAEVLEKIQEIEKRMGRVREIKWGERLIDIDILFYNEAIIDSPELTIPHPYLHYRNFVLTPLLEIAPELIHPVFKKTVRELQEASEDTLVVKAVN